jgi:site-specific DNA-methyltransferase (adenine-specific)
VPAVWGGTTMTPTWQTTDGSVRLYLADCLDVLPTLEAGTVDAVVTDPPYGVGFAYDGHDDTREGYEEWCGRWFDELSRVSPTILMSCGAVNVQMWARIRPFSWQVAWLKPAAMGRSPVGFCNWEPMVLWGSGSGNSVDVFTAGIVPDDALDGHPCPKPLKWGLESIRRAVSSGGMILDCFMGSGTTGVACVRTGRRFIGIEKEPKYFEIAVKRIEAELNRTPLFEAAPAVQRSLIMEDSA